MSCAVPPVFSLLVVLSIACLHFPATQLVAFSRPGLLPTATHLGAAAHCFLRFLGEVHFSADQARLDSCLP